MNNDFFSLFFSQKSTIGKSRALNYASDFGYPFDEIDGSILNRNLVSNGTTFLIHNCYTQDIATSTDGINWVVNYNLKNLVDYSKFGFGKKYGIIGGNENEYPAKTSATGFVYSTQMAVVGNKFIAYVLPFNDSNYTTYLVSKSMYRFPKYVSTNGIDWTEETAQYSNSRQLNSSVYINDNFAFYKPDESLLNMVICSGSYVNKKYPPNYNSESQSSLYGYPSIQVSYDNGDNFQFIDCADAMKSAVLALVNNNTTLSYVQSLTQPMMSANFSMPRYKIHWSSECQKYFLFDFTTRTDTRLIGTVVHNTDGIIYYSTDLISWNCYPMSEFGAIGRALYPLKIGNRLAVIDSIGKLVEIVSDPGNINGHGFYLKQVSSNVPDTYDREMHAFLYEDNSNSIIGLGQGRTTHSIARYTGGLGLNYSIFTTASAPQVQQNPATLRIDGNTVWCQMDATTTNRPTSHVFRIDPSRVVTYTTSNILGPRTYPSIPSIYGAVNAIDKYDNTYYVVTRGETGMNIISTTDWITFNQVVYNGAYSGSSTYRYGILKSNDNKFLLLQSYTWGEGTCIRMSSNLQDPSSFAQYSGAAYGTLNTALTPTADMYYNAYYADHAYSSTTNRYVIFAAESKQDNTATVKPSKIVIVNSDLKTGIYTKTNTTYGRTCLASDNSYWYCGSIGGIYKGDFNNPSLNEVYIPIPGLTSSHKVIAINASAANTLVVLVASVPGGYEHFAMVSNDGGSTWRARIDLPSSFQGLAYQNNSTNYGHKNFLVYDSQSSSYYACSYALRYTNTIYKINIDGSPSCEFGTCRARQLSGMISHNGALYFARTSCFVEVKTV